MPKHRQKVRKSDMLKFGDDSFFAFEAIGFR